MKTKAPNFCCSECAGSVSGSVASPRRRIAERFRRRTMRAFTLCCILLTLTGCDTMGGRTVVVKFKPKDQPVVTSVEQALIVIDKPMASEGIRRVAPDTTDYGRVADYIGGPFICGASFQGSKLTVDFLNPHFGGGPPDPAVKRVSDSVAESLRRQYGANQVSIKDKD
jgi:hypothetical protein